MASGTIGTLAVNIVARTEKFVSGISKSLTSMSLFSKGLSRTTRLLSAFGVALIGVGSVGGFGMLIKGQLDAIDSMAKMSDKLQISTEALAALNLAAEEAGVSTDMLGRNMTKMVRNISEATVGQGVVKELKELGLSASSLNRMTPDKQLLAIVGALEKVRTHADKVRLTEKIFGKGGSALIPMLSMGKQGLIDMQGEAEKLGLVFSRDMAAAVERANDAFGRVKLAVVGLSRQISIQLAPIMEKLSVWFTDIATKDGRITQMATQFVKVFSEGLAKILNFAQELVTVLKELRDLIGDVSGFKKGVQKFSEDLPGVVWESFANPWGFGRSNSGTIGMGTPGKGPETQAWGQQFLGWFNDTIGQFKLGDGLKPAQKSMFDLLDKLLAPIEDRARQGAAQFGGKFNGFIGKMEAFDKELKRMQREQMLYDYSGGLFGKSYRVKGTEPAQMQRGTLAFAQAGSADSYRQQAAMRRQAEPMINLAKQQLAKQEEIRRELAKQNEKPEDKVANF